ncbi:MAG: hypothetical protein AB7I50_01875 [Vicinamibacterales bacterium]
MSSRGLARAAVLAVASAPANLVRQQLAYRYAALDAHGLSAVAARAPDSVGRFIAALYVSDSQLLVLSAEYPVPALFDGRLQRREFQEAYVDLQGASPPQGRFFVHDMQADGLGRVCGSGEPFDVLFERGTERTAFDGDWAGQGLTEAGYDERYATAEARYAHARSVAREGGRKGSES